MTAPIIRPVTDLAGCEHFQELERRIWASPEIEVVPTHVLITAIKNGGMLLGAYADAGPSETGGMVGAAFWWLGVGAPAPGAEPQLKVCSHIVGVLPAWQGQRIGLRLKLAQREAVLAQGFTEWITWTYDPLYRANGVLNIHRLGAICRTYLRDLYGEMQDALNRGVPSDRCQVDWHLNRPHVLASLAPQRERPHWPLDECEILPTEPCGAFSAPVAVAPSLDGRPIAVPIPADIGAIRASDGELSLAWRLYLRARLEEAFAVGYSMVDCIQIPDRGWHYILNQEYP